MSQQTHTADKPRFISTRGSAPDLSASAAILQGLAPDGGLYMPDRPLGDIAPAASYAQTALAVLQAAFGGDYEAEQLRTIAEKAYNAQRFDDERIVPLRRVGDRHVLELFHGPTASFKDLALSVLPPLMAIARQRLAPDREILVLTATSGDTGSATMAGFRDMPGIKVIVFYPEHGVSPVQQAQMQRMAGDNLRAVAIRGDFDQAQRGVKQIFARAQDIAPQCLLSSANSINIGRLIPQMAYYLHAAHQLGEGAKPLFSVPTGNFGDIFAGALAGQSGLSLSGLVCATNDNRVLKDVLDTGVYDRRRPLHKTLSPSMDILVSSNFERAVYAAAQGDAAHVSGLMTELEREGHMTLPPQVHSRLRASFAVASCTDEQALRTMRAVNERHGYLPDPHTACAWQALDDISGRGAPNQPAVVLATASPYKFPQAALSALGLQVPNDAREQLLSLSRHTGIPMPRALDGLFDQPVLHDEVIDPDDMVAYVQRRATAW